MTISAEEVKVGLLVRHKGGKLYKVISSYRDESKPLWGVTGSWSTWEDRETKIDKTQVECKQWQINEKHPGGRFYQASRTLKLKDLTIEG